MSNKRSLDEIVNINVGGKKFTTKRSVLTADPTSLLSEWFKPNATKTPAQDKAGNFFLDRDGHAFRRILTFLRFKKEKIAVSLALPSRPDELVRLMGEADALQVNELREICADMLSRYNNEDTDYSTAYVHCVVREFERWGFQKQSGSSKAPKDAAEGEGW